MRDYLRNSPKDLSLTAINGRQKRHILADKQEHSSLPIAVLTRHKLAESAKIGHNLAESTKSADGFDQPLMRSQLFLAEKTSSQKQDLSVKTHIGNCQKSQLMAAAANLCRE